MILQVLVSSQFLRRGAGGGMGAGGPRGRSGAAVLQLVLPEL